MPAFLRFMCVGLIGLWIVSGACIRADEATSAQYDQILFITAEDDEGRLVPQVVVQRIPQGDENQLAWEKLVTRRFRDQKLGFCKPLGVFSNHLIALVTGHLEAIDLSTGQHRSLLKFSEQAVIVGERVIALGPNGMMLSEVNLRTLEVQQHFGAQASHRARSSFCVSSDGRYVAATHFPPTPDLTQADPFRIYFLDRHAAKPLRKELSSHFGYRLVITGGGDHAQGPVIAWWDHRTILAVTKENPVAKTVFEVADNDKLILQSIDTQSGNATKVCSLPEGKLQLFHDPIFWQLPNGELRLRIAARGDFRIDLQKKELISDGTLTSDYALRGEIDKPTLHFKNEILSEDVGMNRISLSPDGEQIAWLPPRRVRQGIIMDVPATMYVHSAEHGRRNIHTAKKFGGNWDSYESPVPYPNSIILWVTASQLEPMGSLATPE